MQFSSQQNTLCSNTISSNVSHSTTVFLPSMWFLFHLYFLQSLAFLFIWLAKPLGGGSLRYFLLRGTRCCVMSVDVEIVSHLPVSWILGPGDVLQFLKPYWWWVVRLPQHTFPHFRGHRFLDQNFVFGTKEIPPCTVPW